MRGGDEDESHALGHVLLKGLSDDDSPEICREKSALCLQSFLTKVSRYEDSGHVTRSKSFLRKFYIEICPVFHARFLPRSGSGDESKPVEEAEEIRLILVQIMSDIVVHINICRKRGELPTSEEDRGGEALTHHKHTTAATSLVCQSLSRNVFAEKYPDLKRASCILLKAIAKAFPHVVRMHGESLLRPITGGSIQFGLPSGGHGHDTILGGDVLNQESCASSKICLLRHRHAKTRSLALEAVTDIMSCYHIVSEDPTEDSLCHRNSSPSLPVNIIETEINNPTNKNTDENDGSRFSDLLVSHVLPNLESFPPYDRSASVRSALSKAVGKLLKLMMKGKGSLSLKETSYNKLRGDNGEPSQKKSIPVTGRLLALLIMGLSDKAENVRSAASAEFQLIDGLWGREQKETPRSETERIHFFSVFSLDIISILLLNISNSFSNEERTRSLQTLSVTIQILNQKQCLVMGGDIVPYWDESVMTRIVFVLCESLKDNEDVLFQAAVECSNMLGKLKLSRRSASGVIVPALIGENSPLNEFSCHPSHDLHHGNNGNFIYSTPQHFTSALCLLAGILRGGDSLESSDALLDLSEIDEISCAVTNERVLENVFVSSGTATALFDVCHALGRRTSVIAKIPLDSNVNSDGNSYAVRNILYGCVYLLGCPDSYEIHQPVLILLRSLSCALLNEESSSGLLLEVHFKEICDHITEKLHGKSEVQEGLKWQIGDRDLYAFDALLRNTAGSAVGEHFDAISLILERHLARETPLESGQPTACDSTGYETKLFIMALMESIVSDPAFPKDCLHLFAERLIHSAIIPNLAWQVGGFASALRKLSAAVLFSILSCEGGTSRGFYLLAPRLLPILKSNLTDDDASTRELVSASLEKIFEMLPGTLGEESVHLLYPDLVKCLDDSSDSVRLAVCSALKRFLKAASPEIFRGTAIEYIVERLFVHMDDPDPSFQEKIFDVLTTASDVDYSVVLKNIETALQSHKSRFFCQLLKERIEKKMVTQT